MVVRKVQSIGLCERDLALREASLNPPSPFVRYDLSDGDGTMEMLIDDEAEDIEMTFPTNSAIPGSFDGEHIRKASYLLIKTFADRKVLGYYVTDARISGTAPDRFWILSLHTDPFKILASYRPIWNVDEAYDVKGRWSATQQPNDSGLTVVPSNDVMKPSRSIRLPHLNGGLMVVKISSTEQVTVNQATHEVIRKQDTPTTYYAIVDGSDVTRHVPYGSFGQSYPSLRDIMGDIDSLAPTYTGEKPVYGLTASAILDISVSERTPRNISADNVISGTVANDFGKSGQRKMGWCYVQGFDTSSRTENISVSLSNIEYHCGSVSLHTGNDDMIASVPTGILSDGPVQIQVTTVSDLTGIFTELSVKGSHIMMPEGKLPCIGSDWGEYTLAQRSYDRENMTLAVQNAKSEAFQGAVMGAANGVLTGSLVGGPMGAGAGVASFGLGVAGSVLNLQRNERTARAQQDMKEKMLLNSVGSAYNTGYGLEYVRKSMLGRARLQIDLPAHLTQAKFDDFIRWHGYPADEAEKDLSLLTAGWVRGYITDPRIPVYYRTRMNRELTEGVRFV